MEKEIEYLEERITVLEKNVQRDIDYGYTGEIIDDQFYEIIILQNIIEKITQ
tara:strand:+ start:339 stop:494 length:156 start_codon:yes stop_codon:yes gene_type:complete